MFKSNSGKVISTLVLMLFLALPLQAQQTTEQNIQAQAEGQIEKIVQTDGQVSDGIMIENGTETEVVVSETDFIESELTTELDQASPDDISTEQGRSTALPHNLTPWGMYLQADWVVKTVMIGLALASILTWTVFIAKLLELRKAEQEQKAELTQVSAARGIAELISAEQVPEVVKLAAKELERSADALHDPVGIKERLLSGLERFEAASGRKINYGTGVLASIGSTAPFVGLFGTVWGIMNSFIGISRAQTTNLAVVAPGIAEALLATAIGLVAAIPAVIMYNYFSRRISAYKALLADTSAAVLRLVSRDLSRGQVGQED